MNCDYDEFVEKSVQDIKKCMLPKNEPANPLFWVLKNKQLLLKDGMILEFGVHTGGTITAISKAFPNKTIYGFDSFEGLPEYWRENHDKGMFSLNGNIPPQILKLKNVKIIKGWFNDTLPEFKKEHSDNRNFASLVFIDCDLYSSAKVVLENIAHLIVDGTIIVFDELINYPEFRDGELKAFYEFLNENPKFEYEWLALKSQNRICGCGRPKKCKKSECKNLKPLYNDSCGTSVVVKIKCNS